MDTKALLPFSQEPAVGSVLSLMNEVHKIGKLYSLEYTAILKAFFTSRHGGYWCSDIVRCQFLEGMCSKMSLGLSCPNVIE
jgi:hypothetical protein